MKKILFFSLLGCFFFIFKNFTLADCNPPADYSSCPIAILGPKIAANTGLACPNEFAEPPNYIQIRNQYSSIYPHQQMPVTIIYTTKDLSPENADKVVANLEALRKNGLQPIIRISSSVIGSDGWAKISEEEARTAAQTLNNVLSQVSFSQPPVVYFGNEVNLPEEWGGGEMKDVPGHLQEFRQVFASFVEAAGKNRPYQIFLPPMATHQNNFDLESGRQILNYLASRGLKIDGVAVNVYESNFQNMVGEYLRQVDFYKREAGFSKFIIAELGPWEGGRLLQSPDDKETWIKMMTEAFQQILKNPNAFPGAMYITTSFFQDENGDGHPDRTLLVVLTPNGIQIIDLASYCGGFLFTPYLNGLPITTNFSVIYEHSGENTQEISTTNPQGGRNEANEAGSVLGKLRLERADVPDFSQTEKACKKALTYLFPSSVQEKIFIQDNSFKTWYKSYIYGSQGELSREIPLTQKEIPSWWTRLIAESAILKFLKPGIKITNFKPTFFQPPQPSVEKSLNPNLLNSPGKQVGSAPSQNILALQENFNVPSIFRRIIETIYNLVNPTSNLYQKTTRDSTSTTLLTKTRGNLIEGKTFLRETEFFSSLLPKKFDFKASYSLTANASHIFPENAENFHPQEGSDKLNYKELGKRQKDICLFFASLYPSKIDLSKINPLCPSRNPNDYKKTALKIDFEKLNKTDCTPTSSGCDYIREGDHPRCDGDPICEGGKCYPLMWRQAKDYQNCGSPPYASSGATDCNEVCSLQTFSPNPAGGYGPCQYQNPTVCVRDDIGEVGECGALCNWACCAY